MTSREAEVAAAFNAMAGEYDDMRDLWYAWLFSRLHFLMARELLPGLPIEGGVVIDLGCGTGLQSYLCAAAGAEVIGVDIAEDLVAIATAKAATFDPFAPLFPEHYQFVRRYNDRIRLLLRGRAPRPVKNPHFMVARAEQTGLPRESADAVVCCGSVLSLVDDPVAVIREMARILKPGGRFFIETEAKFNLDLAWPVVDAILGGRLGYDTSLREALAPWQEPLGTPVLVEFPFGEADHPVPMHLRLFPVGTLQAMLQQCGLDTTRRFSIHSVTNCIPSTLLDSPMPGPWRSRAFRALARIEESLPFAAPGASVVLLGNRRPL